MSTKVASKVNTFTYKVLTTSQPNYLHKLFSVLCSAGVTKYRTARTAPKYMLGF